MDKNQGQGKKHFFCQTSLLTNILSNIQFDNICLANGRLFAPKSSNDILKWWFLKSDSPVILVLN